MVWERNSRADGEMGRGEEDSSAGLVSRENMVVFVGSEWTSMAQKDCVKDGLEIGDDI